MKNQEKVKALLNGVDVGNEVYCTQMLCIWVVGKLKLSYFVYFLLLDMRYDDKECGHQKS